MSRRAARKEERRTTTITIRLTEADRVAIEQRAAAAGLTVSAYSAQALMGVRLAIQPRRELSAGAMSALARVGNNLNQIAAAMNSGRIPLALDLDTAAADLRSFMQAELNTIAQHQPARNSWHGAPA